MHYCKLLSLQGIASVRFWKSLQKLLKDLSQVSFCFLDIFQLPSASFCLCQLPSSASSTSFSFLQLPSASFSFRQTSSSCCCLQVSLLKDLSQASFCFLQASFMPLSTFFSLASFSLFPPPSASSKFPSASCTFLLTSFSFLLPLSASFSFLLPFSASSSFLQLLSRV